MEGGYGQPDLFGRVDDNLDIQQMPQIAQAEEGGTYSSVNSPPWMEVSTWRCDGEWGSLTARTRNSDVLPAFWSPIIVISISVALSSEGDQYDMRIVSLLEVDCRSGKSSHSMRPD